MYAIHAKKRGDRWQTVDTAKTEPEAMRKYGKHRVELGPEYIMCMTGGGDDGEGKG